MTKAMFDGVVVAESNDVKRLEGMTYFPLDSVADGVLVDSPTTTQCFWKGKATYWHVEGANDVALDAAFTYKKPWPLAKRLVSGRVVFWKGVEIID